MICLSPIIKKKTATLKRFVTAKITPFVLKNSAFLKQDDNCFQVQMTVLFFTASVTEP